MTRPKTSRGSHASSGTPRPAAGKRAAAPQAGSDLVELVDALAGKRILVLADLVADEFVTTGAARVSREAPVLILQWEGSRIVPGGGANAAANIAALGGVPVVVGEVGDDPAGHDVIRQLRSAGADVSGILVRERQATPRKTRILAGDRNLARQQVVRIDRIDPFVHDEPFHRAMKAAVVRALDSAEGVLVSDYGLGFVEPEAVEALVLASPRRKRLRVSLDSRHRLFEHAGVDVATPSEPELEAALGRPLGSTARELDSSCREALARLRAQALVVTRGSLGLMVFEDGEATVTVPAFGAGTVADVTGAGDTVIATLSLALAAGAGPAQAARLANAAAGLAVTKMGTATVPSAELRAALAREAR